MRRKVVSIFLNQQVRGCAAQAADHRRQVPGCDVMEYSLDESGINFLVLERPVGGGLHLDEGKVLCFLVSIVQDIGGEHVVPFPRKPRRQITASATVIQDSLPGNQD